MKKLIALLLVLVLCLALAACGDSKKKSRDDDDDEDDTTTSESGNNDDEDLDLDFGGDAYDEDDEVVNPGGAQTRTMPTMTTITTTTTTEDDVIFITTTTTAAPADSSVAEYAKQIAQQVEGNYDKSQMTVSVFAEGNTLVCVYTLLTVSQPTADQIADFQANMDSTGFANTLKAAFPMMQVECPGLEGYETYYFSADGIMMYSVTI